MMPGMTFTLMEFPLSNRAHAVIVTFGLCLSVEGVAMTVGT